MKTQNTKNRMKNKQGGFLVLTMVLLVSAVVLLISAGVFLRSIGQMNKVADIEKSLEALATANACGDYAVYQLASTTETAGWSYGGNEDLTIEGNTCTIGSIGEDSEVPGSKLIQASSTVSNFVKKISITVATNTPGIVIREWVQVADFE